MQNSISPDDVKYEFGTTHIGFLEGKMLTLIEASTPDKEQRRALKDIVRQTIWGWAIENNMAAHDPHNKACFCNMKHKGPCKSNRIS